MSVLHGGIQKHTVASAQKAPEPIIGPSLISYLCIIFYQIRENPSMHSFIIFSFLRRKKLCVLTINFHLYYVPLPLPYSPTRRCFAENQGYFFLYFVRQKSAHCSRRIST